MRHINYYWIVAALLIINFLVPSNIFAASAVPGVVVNSPQPYAQILTSTPLAVRGTYSDDTGVNRVTVAIFSKSRQQYLTPSKTWQNAWATQKAQLSNPGGTSGNFVLDNITLDPSGYRVDTIAFDKEGQKSNLDVRHFTINVLNHDKIFL